MSSQLRIRLLEISCTENGVKAKSKGYSARLPLFTGLRVERGILKFFNSNKRSKSIKFASFVLSFDFQS
jgi:hypothetical protein